MRIPISNTKQSSHNIAMMFVLSFFFPILGAIFSFFTYRDKNAKNIFWLFCSFLGLIHIFHPEGTVLGEGADGGRYALELISMYYNIKSFDQFLHVLSSNSTFEIYQPFFTFLISRFTSNPHWLFWGFSIVYGYFYSRNIWYILDKIPGKIPKGIWILILFYILICPIWNINGVRMWTALHIYCFGVFPYLFDNDKSKLPIAISSIFVHFSFIMPVALLSIYFLIPNRIRVLEKFLIITLVFFFVTLGIEIFSVKQIGDFLYKIAPNLFETNISGYLGSEYIDRIDQMANEKSILYKVVMYAGKYGISYLVLLCFYLFHKNARLCIYKDNISRIFSFGLLMYSVANILAILPSGSRFIVLARMFILPSIILILSYLGYKNTISNLFTKIVLVLFLLVIVMQFRIGMESYGIDLFFGNFITAIFIESNVSLFMIINSILE